MNVVFDNLGFLGGGILLTLRITVLSFCGALMLGTVMATFRVLPIPPLRTLGWLYVETFRNIPVLSLLVLIVFGLPDVGLTWSLPTSATWCLVLVGGAFVCETVRTGFNNVPRGQGEAVRALGPTMGQSLRHVIVPQALRLVVQPLTNIFIGLLLSSSLAAAVGVSELTSRTQELNLRYAEAVATFLFAGAVYVIFGLCLGALGSAADRRVGSKS